ncbi:MAG: hypothetical protein GY719_02490 [bacterium]|nr:hypothetical protein [bacterium]
MRRILTLGLLCAALPGLVSASDQAPDLARFHDEIQVFGEMPLIQPVDYGQGVHIAFGIGELEIEATDAAEIQTDVRVDCKQLDPERCQRYAQRLRLEPRTKDGVVQVRLVGLRRSQRRKLGIEGRITVPRWAPLRVDLGIGDVEIHAGDEDLAVRMKIGDLTVHAPREAVASVAVATRIGDASVHGGGVDADERRPMLIGARSRWDGGEGDAVIDVGLKIGDAQVVLE